MEEEIQEEETAEVDNKGNNRKYENSAYARPRMKGEWIRENNPHEDRTDGFE